MASVILFNAVDIPSTASCLMPDNGLATLAGCLADAGHQVEVWDLGSLDTVRSHLSAEERQSIEKLRQEIASSRVTAETVRQMQAMEEQIDGCLIRIYQRVFEQLDQRLKRSRVDLLGFKLWYGPGMAESMKMAEHLARRYPHLLVAAGGPMATLVPELILQRHPVVECVCVGEGEEAIVGLAEYCDGRRDLSSVVNVMFRDGASLRQPIRRFTDLNTVPLPLYDPCVYPAMTAGQKIPIIYLDDSRGCTRSCPFCGHRKFTGPARRVLSGRRVVRHMEQLHAQLGTWAFRLTGSSTPRPLYLEIANELLSSGHEFMYSGFAYLSGWRSDEFSVLARSGLVAAFTGIESGSETILRGSLQKRLRPAQVGAAVRRCMDAGIHVCGSVIFPAPGETEQTEAETESFLLEVFENRRDCSVTVQPAFPQPGSRWWDDLERVGFSASPDAILDDLLRRRSRRFLPAEVFQPLPYSLDGQSFADLARRSARLCKRLRSRGILVGVSDDTMLVARAAGYSVREFSRLNHEAFLTGDGDLLSEVIGRVRRRQGQSAARNTAKCCSAPVPSPMSTSNQLLRC